MTEKGKSPVDADIVREMAALLEETGLTEIEIEREGMRVRVARMAVPVNFAAAAPAVAHAGSKDGTPSLEPQKGTVVSSPMVGTVYLSPQPGAPPFVKIGDTVKEETLCIVEAMKTMNAVPAPVAGRIMEIFVRDGQPVEYGEPLMRIE
jgi:acetyl-CoA carboxylase biotin carboxyl carrier protein